MGSQLLDKYGSLKLLRGTELWTRKDCTHWTVPEHETFFHTARGRPLGGHHEYHVVVTRELTLITPFTATMNNRAVTNLHEICDYFGVEGFEQDKLIEWKQDRVKRGKLIEKLVECGIHGWYHPVEFSRLYMEILIFNTSSSIALVINLKDPHTVNGRGS